jgi:2-oxoisovalerate dehydrogenase E2 component (dihydrolipoyl transacylase)
VLELNGAPGDMAAVGGPLVVLEVEGAHAQATPETAPAPKSASEAPPPAAPEPETPPARSTKTGGQILAAPAVRARAKSLGLDLAAVAGSGPDGRVLHADLDALLTRKAEPPGEKIIGLRRKIAQRMEDAAKIPQFGYVEEIDVTEVEALRVRLNAEHSDRPRLTFLPFFLRAVIVALRSFPQMNAHYDAESGRFARHEPVHLGIATQTDHGLLVPVLRDAQALDLWALLAGVSALADVTRAGKASREQLTGSTITVTSLGSLGGIATSPILNLPEVAILGPNRVAERPAVVGGEVVIRRRMNLSSAFDHRVIDGYEAAQFIRAIKTALEAPEGLSTLA